MRPHVFLSLHCSTGFDGSNAEFDDLSNTRSSCTVPPQPTPQMSVRLESNINPSIRQRVDVFVGGAWGTLCSTQFSLREAFVVCKQAGFSTAVVNSDVSMASNKYEEGGGEWGVRGRRERGRVGGGELEGGGGR